MRRLRRWGGNRGPQRQAGSSAGLLTGCTGRVLAASRCQSQEHFLAATDLATGVNRRFRREPGTSQAAEKLISVKGTGFSPYINPAKSTRALAPRGMLFGLFPLHVSFFPSLFKLGPCCSSRTRRKSNWSSRNALFQVDFEQKTSRNLRLPPYHHGTTISTMNSM